MRHPVFYFASLLALVSCSPQVEQWRVMEIPFHSHIDYNATGADEVRMELTFISQSTGDCLVVPAFWDGDSTFRVRFAPVTTGRWEWHSSCPQDISLHGLTGSFRCGKYRGSLDLYKHGFVRAEAGTKYLFHADGTPFFYLGDTHWSMYSEEIDAPGPHAEAGDTFPHFQRIVDRRVKQGFTVYQSEPIQSPFHLEDGIVDSSDIEGFRQADRYYQYIANAGLVHACAEFFFSADIKPTHTDRQLELLSRYWVARFGAYPVLWTLAQEIDNDFYHERGSTFYDYTNNPWVRVAEYIHRYDAYSHPLSGHQEATSYTTITGRGTVAGNKDAEGISVFASEEVARRTGHNWWAVQWSPSLQCTSGADIPADYIASPYPAVNYEGRYCGLWTMNFGARAQGWISFLSGFCGYGYGACDIWLYQSTYDIHSTSFDGIDSIRPSDKQIHWPQALEYESAGQMTILRRFLTSFDWWNLSPILADNPRFTPCEGTAWAGASTQERTILYFYGNTMGTGALCELTPNTEMSLILFNPRTGEQESPLSVHVSSDGTLSLPDKPDTADWVFTLR